MFSLCFAAFLWSAAARAQDSSDILSAFDPPLRAHEARNAGIPEADVRAVLGATKGQGGAGVGAGALDASARGARAHGPVEGCGAFVQARLHEGLRGQALAEAIAAEHQARGQGRGQGPGAGQGAGQGGPGAGQGGRQSGAGQGGGQGGPGAGQGGGQGGAGQGGRQSGGRSGNGQK